MWTGFEFIVPVCFGPNLDILKESDHRNTKKGLVKLRDSLL